MLYNLFSQGALLACGISCAIRFIVSSAYQSAEAFVARMLRYINASTAENIVVVDDNAWPSMVWVVGWVRMFAHGTADAVN